MKKSAKIMLMVLGFGLVAFALVFLTSRPAPAQGGHPSAPVTVTNPPLEPQVASDTVTLVAGNMLQGTGACVLPGYYPFDSSVNKVEGFFAPFTLPPGKVLVVTSFDWTASGSSTAANVARTVSLFPANLTAGLNMPEAQSTALADLNGKAGGSETFPSGVVLKNPGTFCFKADPPPGASESVLVLLNGFLATDQ